MANRLMGVYAVVAAVAVFWICGTATAAVVDVTSLFANAGFESGALTGWNISRPSTVYVSSLTVNPSIDPADPAQSLTTLVAPAGADFTGLTNPGTANPNLYFNLKYDAIPISVASGSVFSVTVFGNRGKLEGTGLTPVSTAEVHVSIFGWTAGAQPTPILSMGDGWSRTINWIDSVYKQVDFTGIADGSWTSQTFTFDPATTGGTHYDASAIKYLSMFIEGVTHANQYVAIDVTPEPATLCLLAVGSLLALRRRLA